MSAGRPRWRRPPLLFFVLTGLLAAIVIVLFVNNNSGESFGLANQDFARGGLLVAILVFVASAFAGRGLKLGSLMRSAAIWLLILLVLIGLYAYREELIRVGGRLAGVLAPGLPIAGSLIGEADPDSVVVIRSMDGHFAVNATVDETPVTFLVDTGASFVTLTPADAEAAGIDVDGLQFGTPIRTANGVIIAAPIVIESLAIGTIERRGVRALVAPSDALDQSLLGMSFLNSLGGYAISGDRLVLTP